MRKISRLITLVVLLLFSSLLHAQEKKGLDSLMRSDGRIYVVIAVILVILAGLILYLIRLDRKISKLERDS